MIFILVFSVWFIVLAYKFYFFGFVDWDFAFFAQAMWQITHQQQYVSVFGCNFLGNHANLIAYLISPIYLFIAHPLVLLLFKIASFALSAQLLFNLAQERLSKWLAWLILFFYMIYVPNVLGMLYEFDFESLAPGLLMVMLLAFLRERKGVFCIAAILLMLIKENMPLIVGAFALMGMYQSKDKKFWFQVGIGSSLVFVVAAFVVVPYFANQPVGHHPYGGHYDSMFERLSDPTWWDRRWSWIGKLFGPLLFLPFFAPWILFPVSAIFLQHALSHSWQEQTLYFAYMLTLTPFIFAALIIALARIRILSMRSFVCFLTIIGCFLVITIYDYRHDIQIRFLMPAQINTAQDRRDLLEMIPPKASVMASFSFLVHLTNRDNLYAFYKAHTPDYVGFKLPDEVEYALIDFNDPWLYRDLRDNPKITRQRIDDFFRQNTWVVKERRGQIVLYQRH